jgi:hypothetical protein
MLHGDSRCVIRTVCGRPGDVHRYLLTTKRTEDTKKILFPPRGKGAKKVFFEEGEILFAELRVFAFLRETFFFCSLRALRLNH